MRNGSASMVIYGDKAEDAARPPQYHISAARSTIYNLVTNVVTNVVTNHSYYPQSDDWIGSC